MNKIVKIESEPVRSRLNLSHPGTVVDNVRFKITIAPPTFATPAQAYEHFTRHLDEIPEASYSEQDVEDLRDYDFFDVMDTYQLMEPKFEEGFNPRKTPENEQVEESEESKVPEDSEDSDNE